MDNVIYHSRDLDGLMSGAIVKNYQNSYWEPCTLYPLDYGEALDTRKFKGKSAVMIDVSMPMDRMELLSTSCMEFMWIDHHISAYNDLIEYCKEMNYEVEQRRINDLILFTEVKKMNLTYYFSNRLAGCEITAIMFDKNLTKTSKKAISLLGQYDTWRQFDERKFVDDSDWDSTVLPFQFGLRAKFNDPEKISDFIDSLNLKDKKNESYESLFDDIKNQGKLIIEYQERIDQTNVKGNAFEMDFDFDGKTYKAVCLNSTVFNSNVFKSVYYENYHDIMIAFQYNGKTDRYKFSMYTTKEDVNILGIAKSFGGGGHAKACGFEIPANNIEIKKSVISIFNNKKSDIPKNLGVLEFDDMIAKEDEVVFDDVPKIENKEVSDFKMPKGYMLKHDDKNRCYWIQTAFSKKFETSVSLIVGKEYEEAKADFDAFEEEFGKYRTSDPEECPEFLYEKLKDRL